jgi:hypothetical protein
MVQKKRTFSYSISIIRLESDLIMFFLCDYFSDKMFFIFAQRLNIVIY